MDQPTDKLLVNFQVTRQVRHDFKLACLELYTTMADVLRDAIAAAIIRAAAEREKRDE